LLAHGLAPHWEYDTFTQIQVFGTINTMSEVLSSARFAWKTSSDGDVPPRPAYAQCGSFPHCTSPAGLLGAIWAFLFIVMPLPLPAAPGLLEPRLEVSDRVASPSSGFWQDGPDEAAVEQIVERMTAEERVAQLFMLGWEGIEPSTHLQTWLEERGVGGVKVFGWNANHVPRLARSLGTMQKTVLEQHSQSIPLLTATDQEGGWVRHVHDSTSLTAGNMAIGATGLPADGVRNADLIGQELRAIGINMNFAPTVDVYRHPEAHVIGPRAFGDDPVQTGMLGTAYYHGLEHNRVVAAAKHFPGHGGVEGDSHVVRPVLTASRLELEEKDLLPYRMLIPEGLPAVLSAHLAVPALSGDPRLPASLSSEVMIDLLRDELGFEGLAITDDMYMQGARIWEREEGLSFAQLLVEAIRAGNDMIMLSETPPPHGEIWNTMLEAYRTDPQMTARIDESVKRIVATKRRYLLDDRRVPLAPVSDELADLLPASSAEPYFTDHATRAVTVIADEDLPLTVSDDDEILLAGNMRNFFAEGRRRFPDADEFSFPYGQSPAVDSRYVEQLRDIADEYDVIVFNLATRAAATILSALSDHSERTAVVSALTPIYFRDLPWVRAAVAIYGMGTRSYRAGFDALLGDIRAHGSLPISPSRFEDEGR